LSRLRHIGRRCFWLRELSAEKDLRFSPILENQRPQGIRLSEASGSKSHYVGGALAHSINAFFVRAYIRAEDNLDGGRDTVVHATFLGPSSYH